MKTCGECGESKSVEAFSRRARMPDGLMWRCKSCCVKASRKCQIERRTKAKRLLGNKCMCPGCPETNPSFLTFDHINNNGHLEGSNRDSNIAIRYVIKNLIQTKYQLLCWNCNSGRWANGGICPHLIDVGGY